ncbi:hypothetical protein F9C07_12398 [Aspergillus flavus]|uniref:AtmA protein n=3 Tax=Aspergillus subgen. Circumdati TaxID=2720871 RepID=A0A7U2R1G2_ASPFN|nr:hypothetical protein AFLA_013812 [Aspergillus flavus NRRL3357]KAJ1705051.1 hypothetical protein NYO67_12789 [Aspergillus flavus]QRD92429.1 hypothetical protein F9C07_12398 [Aspergillus flavus]RMZ44138.1 hypothetical protein CA14_004233 [Aspergillus flavus]UDD65822.1 hypothetical protein AFCA_012991 [Aspergillus flavus]
MAIAKVLLPSLSLFVFYAIFYYADINGLRALGEQYIASGTLPGTNEPIRTIYTGIEPIDHLLTTLTAFFWPTTDGSHPSLLLHSIAFSGTFGSAWVLITLEAWRKGNAWTIAAFPMIFGLTAQVLTFAFAAPLYCFFHLITSRTAKNPTPDTLRIPRSITNTLPLVFILGYMVPTQLLILPISEHITFDLKQIFIAIWQPWPAYISIILTLIYTITTPFTSSDRTTPASERKNLSSLRWVYAFAFGNTALTHLVSWIVSLASVLVPDIFNPEVVDYLHPGRVFEVPIPWEEPVRTVASVGHGVHAFLRWDYIIGSLGVLVWAGSLHGAAQRGVYGSVGWLGLLWKVGLLSVFVGPVGAAVELMWEREELVLAKRGLTESGKKDP